MDTLLAGLRSVLASRRAVVVATLLFTQLLASTPSAAQTWFTEPKPEPVKMLRELFRSPVTEWERILTENRSILNQSFFDNVAKRIRWGVENGHIDDAHRFALVGDMAARVTGSKAVFRSDLQELLNNDPRHGVLLYSFDTEVSLGGQIFVFEAQKMEELAPWNYWPSQNCRHKQKVIVIFRSPLSDWEKLVREDPTIWDDKFFRRVSEIVEARLEVRDDKTAVIYALIGDMAGEVVGTKPNLGRKVTTTLSGRPIVVDRRDGSMISFPGGGYRSTESVVPWIE